MRPSALALLVLLSLGGLAAAEPAKPSPDTAQQLGDWFRRGVERLAVSVRTGAADLWAAGKSAFDAGARSLHERAAAEQRSTPAPAAK
jgi:hypothetical protein